MQQGGSGGGGGGGSSQYGMPPVLDFTSAATTPRTTHQLMLEQQQRLQQQQQHKAAAGDATSSIIVETASPISSRPPQTPARTSGGNFEDLVSAASAGGSGFPDEEGFDGAERGVGGGNRWPRQETMALLKIRSEMDAAFRDATLKGPLWEDVSRKLGQQGYTRSGKKCKEKFENVHKYYKRTKEGRAGRQDGKSYRFFSQLEALHTTPTTSAPAPTPISLLASAAATTSAGSSVPPLVSIGIGMVGGSSPRIHPSDPGMPAAAATTTTATASAPTQIGVSRPDLPIGLAPPPPPLSGATTGGISFSSNTSSSNSEEEDEDSEDDDLLEANAASKKRKRESTGGGSSRKMMDFFEGLMKQVMEKQEAMQQRFLETIEKREQERMAREDAWKRQEMARLAREHEIMAQERAISASRDAAIIAFLQKISGQTIQFPTPVLIPAAPPPVHSTPPPPAAPVPTPPAPQPQPQPQPQTQQHHHRQQQPQQKPQQQQHHTPSQSTEIVRHQPAATPTSTSTDVVLAAVPEQQHPPQSQEMIVASGGSLDSTSSRWPKQEVLALIKLRSNLDARYQEAGPKGPLWEEISTGMQRMGYNRSSKRCKEKWENINKYFKKVKESNKKRPEDAKTCPYFHQLDALYRKKLVTGGGTSTSSTTSSFGHQSKQEDSMAIDPSPAAQSFQAIMAAATAPLSQPAQSSEAENKNINPNVGTSMDLEQQQTSKEGVFGEGNSGASAAATSGALKKPEDIMKELIQQHHHNQQQHQQNQQQPQQQLGMGDYDKMEEGQDSDNLELDEEYEDDNEDEETEEESKLAYKIQFQRPNAGGTSSNGGGGGSSGNAPNSLLAMVQ